MDAVQAYGLGLAVAIGVAMLWGNRGLWLAAAVMLLEWAAANGAVSASGRFVPAEAFAFIDFLAAACLLRDERSTAEVIIGGAYLALFVIDGGYLLSIVLHGLGWLSGSPSQGFFLWMRAGGGWVQIAVLAAGGLANGPGKRWWKPAAGAWPVGVGFGVAGIALAAGVAKAAT